MNNVGIPRGNYGFLKCLGPIKIDPEGNANLEVFCKGSDHLENNFSIKLRSHLFKLHKKVFIQSKLNLNL